MIGAVSGATLTRDETRVLTWTGDGIARLWDIGHDRWPRDKLTLRYEVGTGTRLNDLGEPEVIPPKD